jgi:predicted acylesterase/phospholipase RssA
MKKHGIFNDDSNTDHSFADSPQKYEPNAQFINLAIQGGGAHGAYAWGIIDRFIQEGRIRFEGICATSAGSMNAVVLAYGSMTGGPRGARAALHHFWKKISEMGATYSPLRQTPFEFYNNRVNNKWNMDNSISYQMFDFITRIFSPYQFNPFEFNPLIHSIRADKELCDLSVASKINTDWHFLLYLRDLGRKAADQWLQENFNSLGKRSTVDLHAEFLDLGVEHMG